MCTCEEYVKSHGLTYTVKECAVDLWGGRGKLPSNVPPTRLNNVEVERVYQHKYLGHFVTDRLNYRIDIENVRRALAIRCNLWWYEGLRAEVKILLCNCLFAKCLFELHIIIILT